METTPPDPIEAAALAGLLHSFYNGIENLMKRVAVHSGEALHPGPTWHSALLEAMATEGPTRPALLKPGLLARLRAYLGFRHVYRHSYTFQLRWEKMRPLVDDLGQTLREFEEALARLPS